MSIYANSESDSGERLRREIESAGALSISVSVTPTLGSAGETRESAGVSLSDSGESGRAGARERETRHNPGSSGNIVRIIYVSRGSAILCSESDSGERLGRARERGRVDPGVSGSRESRRATLGSAGARSGSAGVDIDSEHRERLGNAQRALRERSGSDTPISLPRATPDLGSERGSAGSRETRRATLRLRESGIDSPTLRLRESGSAGARERSLSALTPEIDSEHRDRLGNAQRELRERESAGGRVSRVALGISGARESLGSDSDSPDSGSAGDSGIAGERLGSDSGERGRATPDLGRERGSAGADLRVSGVSISGESGSLGERLSGARERESGFTVTNTVDRGYRRMPVHSMTDAILIIRVYNIAYAILIIRVYNIAYAILYTPMINYPYTPPLPDLRSRLIALSKSSQNLSRRGCAGSLCACDGSG